MLSLTVSVAFVATLFSQTVQSAPISNPILQDLVPQCEDLPLGSASTVAGRLCLEPLISDELLSHFPVVSNNTIKPRFESYRSDFENLMDGSKLWCAKPSRGAPQPRQHDVLKLCHNLPDTITVAPNNAAGTAYNNMALCQVFDEGTARYRVCNLDSCASQTFMFNKRNCFKLNNKCPKAGSFSGYIVGKNSDGMGKAAALTGTRMMGDYPFEHNDDKFFMEQFESTCSVERT